MKAVDIFSGAGGFTCGAEQAGVSVVWAANHWELAVEYHSRNFPHTEHVCQDLNLFPSIEIPDHDLLLASPSCKGFSLARGKDRPHHDKHRSTAWIVIDVLEAKSPPLAIIENVPEMVKWKLFPSWKDAIMRLGYSMVECVLDAADYGVPQHRKRWFGILSKSKNPLPIESRRLPHVPVSTVLDWSAGRWQPIHKPRRAKNTLRRIRRAIREGHGTHFLIPFYGSGSGLTGRSLDKPIGTLTTKARWALVNTDRNVMRMLSVKESRECMSFPGSYILPPTIAQANAVLGNAVCPQLVTQLITDVRAVA